MEYSIAKIQNPNRFYALPLVGLVAKLVMIIPVALWLWAVSVAYIFIMFINSFMVMFTGKYWDMAFNVTKLMLSLTVKLQLFISGLTDIYPGFGSEIKDANIKLNLVKPENPNRLFAIPLFGGIVRAILLIPFAVWIYIVDSGARLGVVLSFYKVLFKAVYPDSTYEFYSDATRLNAYQFSYFSGISDRYPSFKISWNHKWIKIALIAAGLLLGILNFKSGIDKQQMQVQNNYSSGYNINKDSKENSP